MVCNIEIVGSELMCKLVGTNTFKAFVFHWKKKKQKRGRMEGKKKGRTEGWKEGRNEKGVERAEDRERGKKSLQGEVITLLA
jgi:hypothetical protein